MTELYDRAADEYIALFGDDVSDPATGAAIDLLGDVTGLRVLDVPCGNGRVAREVIRRGARSVVAVDISSVMLERARETGDARGIDYRIGDLTAQDLLAGDRFDAVICNYGLNEIEDLAAGLRSLHRLLADRGRLAASILHPCFPGVADVAPGSAPPEGYYHEGRWAVETADVRAELGSLHRMLSTYLNALVRSGFSVEEMVELPQPGIDPVPIYLAFSCRRAT